MSKKKLHHLRESYEKDSLSIHDVAKNPFEQFSGWFQEAQATSKCIEPNAMVLSTSGKNNLPASRYVLLKEYSEKDGFVFFTNYQSRKGKHLQENPNVSLLFYWPEMERQVRIEGKVEKLSEKDSDAYFYSRPVDSQIGAIASPQSAKITEDFLEHAFQKAKSVAKRNRPQHWGGYKVIANYFEFWQGKPNRLHDRISYSNANNEWLIERLAP